jgi:hypothetical protein
MEHFQTFKTVKTYFFTNISQFQFETHYVLKTEGPYWAVYINNFMIPHAQQAWFFF